MKINLFGRLWIASLLVAWIVPAASAQSLSGFYVGIEGGLVDYTGSESGYEAALRKRGHNVSVKLYEQSIGVHGYIGFNVWRYANFELGYVDLGGFDAKISGSTTNFDALVDAIRDLQPVAGKGPTIAFRLTPRLTQRLNASLRLGGFYRISNGDIRLNGQRVGGVGEDQFAVFGGAGLRIYLWRGLSLNPEISVFDFSRDHPSVFYSAGLIYQFSFD